MTKQETIKEIIEQVKVSDEELPEFIEDMLSNMPTEELEDLLADLQSEEEES